MRLGIWSAPTSIGSALCKPATKYPSQAKGGRCQQILSSFLPSGETALTGRVVLGDLTERVTDLTGSRLWESQAASSSNEVWLLDHLGEWFGICFDGHYTFRSLHFGLHIERFWAMAAHAHGLCSTWEAAFACWKHLALSSHPSSVTSLVVRKGHKQRGKLNARNLLFPSPVPLFLERLVRTMPAILYDLRIVLIGRKVHGIRGFSYSHISTRLVE
jgi:hypothetical protein